MVCVCVCEAWVRNRQVQTICEKYIMQREMNKFLKNLLYYFYYYYYCVYVLLLLFPFNE